MNNVDWDDLPKEILRLVMEKLRWSERVPLSSVCKTWHKCFLEIQNPHGFLPWVMCYDWNRINHAGICKLVHPFTKTSYIVETTRWKNIDLSGADPLASRDGWVLFSKLVIDFSSSPVYHNSFFYLYSPFTNEIIEFPVSKMDFSRKATFSNSPDSPDCMVIAFWGKREKLYIKTCQPGDKSWKIYEFTGEHTYHNVLEVIYTGGSVYCAFIDLNLKIKLGAFKIKQQEWEVLGKLVPRSSNRYKALFVAFNGDLLMYRRSYKEQQRFWRFDLSENKWVVVKEEIMKKQAIFAGCTPFSVPAVENARESAGKLHYFNHNWSKTMCFPFYSNDVEKESEDYGCLEEAIGLKKLWIQPPFQRI